MLGRHPANWGRRNSNVWSR